MKKVSKTVSNMWFDGELKRLKKPKRKAYCKFFKKSDVFSKNRVQQDKKLNRHERVIKTKNANYYKQQLEKYRTDARSLWNTINKIVEKSCF